MTLNELMIVVLIVSVTAALAIPTYVKAVERARGDEALGMLRLLRAAEKVYYFDNNDFYTDLTVAAPGPLVTAGYIQNPNGDPGRAFDYDVAENNAANPSSFAATATRRSGCNVNETVTLDDLGNQAGSWTIPCGP